MKNPLPETWILSKESSDFGPCYRDLHVGDHYSAVSVVVAMEYDPELGLVDPEPKGVARLHLILEACNGWHDIDALQARLTELKAQVAWASP